jgi:eukaryotic-like serine/threonine-protein kinase
VGTAAYLAPEQVRGEWVGPEADVYALGLVLLESLTGRREYPGALVESATARLHRPPGIPAGLPFALDTALRAMTALDPVDRPAAADVAAMLAGAASRRGRRRAGAHRRARPVSPRIAGAATILAVAAVVTAASLPPAERPVPSVTSHDPVGPETRTPAVVPPRAVPWEPASAAVSLHRVAATLGESAEAARLRAEAIEKALRIRTRVKPAERPD